MGCSASAPALEPAAGTSHPPPDIHIDADSASKKAPDKPDKESKIIEDAIQSTNRIVEPISLPSQQNKAVPHNQDIRQPLKKQEKLTDGTAVNETMASKTAEVPKRIPQDPPKPNPNISNGNISTEKAIVAKATELKNTDSVKELKDPVTDSKELEKTNKTYEPKVEETNNNHNKHVETEVKINEVSDNINNNIHSMGEKVISKIEESEIASEKTETAVLNEEEQLLRLTRWEAMADVVAELPARIALDPLTGQIYAKSVARYE